MTVTVDRTISAITYQPITSVPTRNCARSAVATTAASTATRPSHPAVQAIGHAVDRVSLIPTLRSDADLPSLKEHRLVAESNYDGQSGLTGLTIDWELTRLDEPPNDHRVGHVVEAAIEARVVAEEDVAEDPTPRDGLPELLLNAATLPRLAPRGR